MLTRLLMNNVRFFFPPISVSIQAVRGSGAGQGGLTLLAAADFTGRDSAVGSVNRSVSTGVRPSDARPQRHVRFD